MTSTTDTYETQYLALCQRYESLRRWQSHGRNYRGPCRLAGKHFCGPLPEKERMGALVRVGVSAGHGIAFYPSTNEILATVDGMLPKDAHGPTPEAGLTAALLNLASPRPKEGIILTSKFLYQKDEDTQLRDSFHTWLSNSVFQVYDDPEVALKDVLELLEDWGRNWIDDVAGRDE